MEKQDQIMKVCLLECKKHIKIYKLNQLGLSNKEFAGTLGTNIGHIYNVLKDYSLNPNKQSIAINTV